MPIWEQVGAVILIPVGLPSIMTNNYDLAMENYKVGLCHYVLLQHAMTAIQMAPCYDCYKLTMRCYATMEFLDYYGQNLVLLMYS
jgi:hypothetical protein